MIATWFLVGALSHLFWWWLLLERERDAAAWFAVVMCILTLLPATLLGPVTFALEGGMYWLIESGRL